MVSEGTVVKDKDKKSGYVLVVALVTTIAVGVIATGLVGLTLQERRLAARSSAYSKALFAAESGADLACEEFSKQSGGASAWSGWASSGSSKSSSSNLAGGSQYSVTALNSADLCTITATGQVSVAGVTVQRVVKVTVKKVQNTPQFFKYGIMSKASISIGGSVKADSFDSTDPTKSTNGQYDPIKAAANVTLATLSSANPAIKVSGGARLDGISTLSVAPGGVIDIAHYIPYTGIKTYDAAQAIPDVVVPSFPAPTGSIDTGPWATRFQTITVNGSKDVSLQNLKVVSDGTLTITGSGTLRIYVDGEMEISGSGSLVIKEGVKVEFYANDDLVIKGSGKLNNESGKAANCAIWGTETCTKVYATGNSAYIGTVYAPYAEVDLTGSSSATGAFLGGAVKFSGSSTYHIDESLFNGSSSPSSGSGKPYTLLEWVEL
jgi:Tfp pilus assembly protein PilX